MSKVNPRVYSALAIASALEWWQKYRRPINRAYTPKSMMAAAKRLTGRTFAPRDYQGAADALRDWAWKQTIEGEGEKTQ